MMDTPEKVNSWLVSRTSALNYTSGISRLNNYLLKAYWQ